MGEKQFSSIKNYDLLEISGMNDRYTELSQGKMYRNVGVAIKETLSDGSTVMHNISMKIHEDEAEKYIDFSNTRFKDTYGKVYVEEYDKRHSISVQGFIEKHQGATFDIMTPGGYVYLTPERVELLLSGEDVKGDLGLQGTTVDISREELLTQRVIRTEFSAGKWNLLSENKLEIEQNSTMDGISNNMKEAQGNNVFVLSEQGYLERAAKGLKDIKPGHSFPEYKNKVPKSWAEKGWVKEVSPDALSEIQQNQSTRQVMANNKQPVIDLEP